MADKTQNYNPRKRRFRTRRGVKLADKLAGTLITLGGLGTILAVVLVFVFLSWVVVPLFLPSEIANLRDLPNVPIRTGAEVLATDEYLVAGWALADGGSTLRAFRLDDGRLLEERSLFGGEKPQALAVNLRERKLIAALSDGSLHLGEVGFTTSFVPEDAELPDEVRRLEAGQRAVYDLGVVERTTEGQLRLQKLESRFADPVQTGAGDIRLIDMTILPGGPVISTLGGDGTFRIQSISSRRNLLTGKVTTTLSGGEVRLPEHGSEPPAYLKLAGNADTAYLLWRDGFMLRLDTRDLTTPVLAEERDLITEADVQLTSVSFLIGKSTLVTGDSLGRVQAWFRIKPENAGTVDGSILLKTHDLGRGPAAVTSLTASLRSRLLGAGFADGTVRINHVTSDQVLLEEKVGSGPVSALTLSPKDDAFAALTSAGLSLWKMDAPHPETTLHTLFAKVHYEGMSAPAHIWQSSSGTDDFEPKYGLIPLIFGTLKATFYTMLFAVPIALLAAIYTSEFMHSRLRGYVKPLVELMASLPSVVLGFLAALVVAPYVEDIVPAVLSAFITLPLAFALAAYLFQLLPAERFVRWSRWRFFILCFIALPVGAWLAQWVGPLLEQLLFAGDIKAWLNGRVGSSLGGWMLLGLPLGAIGAAILISRVLTPRLRNYTLRFSRLGAGWFEIGKFVFGLGLTLILTLIAAVLMQQLGFDSRGDFPLIGPVLDTYIQRNAMVVGIMMGFAVIPIIYTLAEDALSSVPEHLRSASLAAGATPWQTAVRIIIPTAASGLFSAIMIGLGRAVGETMIVLMAAGNTPVLEMNFFNGFRTLSANIAVELPEAVVYSSHFRVLFLAALTLFIMTFVVNTLAEVVRQRFRKRAYQL